MRRYSNVIGFDDAPFVREHRGDVPLIGTVCTQGRLDGVLVGKIRRDGRDSTRRIATMLLESPFAEHVQAVLLQGIAVGGFNVVDIHELHTRTGLPVLVVARRAPGLPAIRAALLGRVRGGARKWALIERAGPMEPCEGVWIQRAGLEPADAASLLRTTSVHGKLPEALRLAHLIAGAIGDGHSKRTASRRIWPRTMRRQHARSRSTGAPLRTIRRRARSSSLAASAYECSARAIAHRRYVEGPSLQGSPSMRAHRGFKGSKSVDGAPFRNGRGSEPSHTRWSPSSSISAARSPSTTSA